MAIEKVIPFNKITLNKNEDKPITITYNNSTIELRKPSTRDIYDLIMITLQKADIDGVYNPFLIDIYFHLNLIFTYAKITFSDEDRLDEFELYDKLNNSGLMQAIIDAIPSDEYRRLMKTVDEVTKENAKYRVSAASILKTFVQDLPKNAAAAQKIVNDFDPKKYQAVINFATAANGGRPINGLDVNIAADKTE